MEMDFFEKMRIAQVPFAGSLEVTHRCNLRCAHCYQFPPRPGEMSLEQIVRLIGRLQEAGCLFLNITGGEPLVRADILEILGEASERHFALNLQTNAMLLDRRMADELARLAGLRVDLSLYAATEEEHDSFTGTPGSFRACLQALELLRERNIPTMTKTIVTVLNLDRLEEIKTLAEERGAVAFFSPMVFPRNDRDPAPLRFRLSDAQLATFQDFQLRHLEEAYGDIRLAEDWEAASRPPGCADIGLEVQGRSVRGCGAAKTTFAINPYGDVYPCVAWPFVVGNVLEDDFAVIWKESLQLEELRRKEFNLDEECTSCRLLENCPLCRALSYVEEGDAQALSRERCRQTRIWIRGTEDGRD
jgi:radical SAM protein with 4Fe4S-binding SPASM domain